MDICRHFHCANNFFRQKFAHKLSEADSRLLRIFWQFGQPATASLFAPLWIVCHVVVTVKNAATRLENTELFIWAILCPENQNPKYK